MDLRTAQRLTPAEFHRRRGTARGEDRERQRRDVLERARQAISGLAPDAGLRRVYLFGSVLRAGAFHDTSDVDVAVLGDDPAAEAPFARRLEAALGRSVDLRPYAGAVAEAVDESGLRVYG